MRIPVVSDIDSRDGVASKDERLTNVIAENDDDVTLAVVRPGLSAVATASGNGNGVVNFDAVLISVFGTTLGQGTNPTSVGTVANGSFDFAQSHL